MFFPAARVARELARVVADKRGSKAAQVPNAVSTSADDLLPSARPKEVLLTNGQSLWVATDLSCDYSEALIKQLLQRAQGLELSVMSHSELLTAGS